MEEDLKVEINWDVDQDKMREQVQGMIEACRRWGKVLVLPLSMSEESIFLILSQVDCRNCDAICCQSGPAPVTLLDSEYASMKWKKLPERKLSLPCQFLDCNLCAIYKDRPMNCLMFPIQRGGRIADKYGKNHEEALALASYCPEARRIAMRAYMVIWEVKYKATKVSKEEISRILRGH